MGLRSIAHDDPAIEEFKELIDRYRKQLEVFGLSYQLHVLGDEVVGLTVLGKEPYRLYRPVGTPFLRLMVLDYNQSIDVLKSFADAGLSLAKERDVDFAYLTIPFDQKELAEHLEQIGFEELANRYEMNRPLDESIEVSNLLRYEQIRREDVNQFFERMKEFMIGSSDVILNMVLDNFAKVPEVLLDYWYENKQVYFVYHGDELIGILDLVPQDGSIMNIGVAPAHRGKGYGSEMLRFSLKLFQEAGRETADLGVQVENKRAIHVYEKMGFSVAEQIQTLMWLKPT